jgi:hypothetical protein
MTELTSKVFTGYPVKFTGTYKKECPDDMTRHGTGILPLTPPTIKLTYKFPFCHLDVSMDLSGSDTNNKISAGASVDSFPEKELFDPRMDEFYLQNIDSVEKAYEEVRQDLHIVSAYPDLLFQGIFDMKHFHRYLHIKPEGSETRDRMSSLENALSSKYGSTLDFDRSEHHTYDRQITLGNDVKIGFYAFGSSTSYMVVSFPLQFPEQEYREIKEFIFEHESIKGRNSITPEFSGDGWMLVLNTGGYYILDNIFREDIAMLPK